LAEEPYEQATIHPAASLRKSVVQHALKKWFVILLQRADARNPEEMIPSHSRGDKYLDEIQEMNFSGSNLPDGSH
jgi:hypothetical protein